MGESNKCKYCEESATIHLTQIIDSKIHKIDLCEKCAKEKGITNLEETSLTDFMVTEDTFSKTEVIDKVCEQCGFSTSDFKKKGRLGCPSCYEALSEPIKAVVKGMHKGLTHTGKVPHRAMERKIVQDQINDIDHKLRCAISEERYEDAAHYRDQLNALRSQLQIKTTS